MESIFINLGMVLFMVYLAIFIVGVCSFVVRMVADFFIDIKNRRLERAQKR